MKISKIQSKKYQFVWILTEEGKIYYRSEISEENKAGLSWTSIEFDETQYGITSAKPQGTNWVDLNTTMSKVSMKGMDTDVNIDNSIKDFMKLYEASQTPEVKNSTHLHTTPNNSSILTQTKQTKRTIEAHIYLLTKINLMYYELF
ncbi:hypothetical protein MXB_1613 [Myxobolus squamalis]|nr:hypothetical protein MXB_1613 [Myxobolus squamalis]